MTVDKKIVLMLVLAAALSGAKVLQAHPADMYFQSHELKLARSGVYAGWTVKPGPLLVPYVWNEADGNRDGQVDHVEARRWVEARLSNLAVAVDSRALAWQLESVKWPASFETFQVGEEAITIQVKAAWPKNMSGTRSLTLQSGYEYPISTFWYSLRGEGGIAFHTPRPHKGLLSVDVVFTKPGAAAGKELLDAWQSGTPFMPGAAGAEGEQVPEVRQQESRSAGTFLTDLVREKDMSLSFFLFALAMAVLLGALHSLAPGHGKTLVAAYLVGSHGTVRHAVALGAIVTLTHIGSVFVLGLIALAASRYIMPAGLFPVLEMASGLLIVALGGYLLYKRWRAWRERKTGDRHHHGHDHPHDKGPGKVTWRPLLALGISGGLVPCPDAIAILLVAIAINRLALGLTLIAAFSLGLSIVLIAIGIAMVQGVRLMERAGAFKKAVPVLPVFSAALILGLGLVLTIAAATGSGFLRPAPGPEDSLQGGGALKQKFSPGPAADLPGIREASLLYVAPDKKGRSQLFVLSLSGGRPLPLTGEPFGVWDYGLSPDGKSVVYTSLQKDGGTGIWRVGADGLGRKRLLQCTGSVCRGGVWAPDGRRVVYEKRAKATPGAPLSLSSLWWLETSTGETGPLFRDSELPGNSPRWSHDGQWLSYFSPGGGKVQVYHFEDGRSLSVPCRMRKPVFWRPGRNAFLMIDLKRLDEEFFQHLFLFDVESGTLTELSGEKKVRDTSAAWSPDGRWIAVVRRDVSAGDTPAGNSLWVMRPDGAGARQVTKDPDAVNETPVLSPDGRYLLYKRSSLKGKKKEEGLWLTVIETGETKKIVTPGSRPTLLY